MNLPEIFNGTPFVQLLGHRGDKSGGRTRRGDGPPLQEGTVFEFGRVGHPRRGDVRVRGYHRGAAVISRAEDVTPTVDMRIDYLAPATCDLHASADVLRFGESLAMTRVEIHDEEGTHVATAQGTYKTGGQGGETPWNSRAAKRNDD